MTIIQRLTRWYWLKQMAYHRWLDRRKLALAQRRCNHRFRPAVADQSPARICSQCGKVETLTMEQFFAYFGEQGFGAGKFR